MPRNSRPGTFFGDWDLEWKGSTQTERKLAQNQYDIEEQLEKLNKNLNDIKTNNSSTKHIETYDISVEDICKAHNINYDLAIKFFNLFNKKVLQEIPKDVHIETPEEYMDNLKENNIRHNNLMAKATNVKQLSVAILIFVLLFGIAFNYNTIFTESSSFLMGCLKVGVIIVVVSIIWMTLTNLYTGFKYIRLIGKNNNVQEEKKEIISLTFEKLKEFRLSHYNTSIERIIKQLTVPKIQNYYGMYISPNDITGYGTIKDYEEYFRKELEKDSN